VARHRAPAGADHWRVSTPSIPPPGEQDLLSYEIFKSAREIDLQDFEFPDHLMPINQFYSDPNQLVQMGSGSGIQPFATVQDYDNFLSRIDGFLLWMQQAQENMRQGMTEGYTQPRILMEKVLPQLESQLVDGAAESSFYQPITHIPDSFSRGPESADTMLRKPSKEN
jgi:uncharacterized protein (DUF885 family)